MASKQPNPILPLHTRFGPYHLEKLIAVGGMAEIYLARAKGLAGFEKQLALKVIHADLASDQRFTEMLVQEAKLAVGLNHANIVKTFDLGKIGSVYFITMEYVDGLDYFRVLKQLSEQNEHIPIEAALFVAREVALGLDYAHARCDEQGAPLGLIHRDISPQNILLSRHGEVKIADFGVAKVSNMTNQTRAGVIKGKLVYMSPEQSWGEQIDQRSDIFSAGIVLYEALTGGSLYVEQSPVTLLQQVREARIAPPSTLRPDLGGELDDLVMKALARDPAQRYQTAHELEVAVGALLRHYAPEYNARDLAELVRALADDEPVPRSKRARRPRTSPQIEPMQPNDFAIPRHSVVYVSGETAADRPSADLIPDDGGDTGSLVAKIILEREDGPTTYDINERFTIGRGGELRLSDGRVSRRHARVVRREGGYVLEDLNSSNGTFVNRERINGAHVLQHDDVIHIGPYQMRFALEHEDETRKRARADRPTSEPHAQQDAGRSSSAESSVVSSPASGPRLVAAAAVVIRLGDELLHLEVKDRLPIDHALSVGGERIQAAASAIVQRDNAYWIEPTAGRSPVSLNGQLVETARLLSPGDELQVGPLRLRFQAAAAEHS